MRKDDPMFKEQRSLRNLYTVAEFKELVPDLIDEGGITIKKAVELAGFKSRYSYQHAMKADGINGIKTLARILALFGIEIHLYIQIKRPQTALGKRRKLKTTTWYG